MKYIFHFLFLLFFTMPLGVSFTSSAEISFEPCETFHKEIKDLQKQISLDNFNSPGDEPIDLFDALSTKYHEEMSELFNSEFKKFSGEQVEDVCTATDPLEKETLNDITEKMFTKLHKYSCTLEYLADNPTLKKQANASTSFLQAQNQLYSQEYKYREEIENATAALHLTLQMYEELRLWYPVHMKLKCLSEKLQAYNTSIREFVDMVVIMPAKFLNYSSLRQQ